MARSPRVGKVGGLHGVVEVTEDMAAILGGASNSVDYGDQYFFTNPRLETGDERYQWVNRAHFLGEGRLSRGRPSTTACIASRTTEFAAFDRLGRQRSGWRLLASPSAEVRATEDDDKRNSRGGIQHQHRR
jgi:Protein of unknown function (DUF3237)